MKKALWMISVLAAIGLICGLSLSSVYRYAAPLIAENKKRALEESIYKVLQDIARYEVIEKEGLVIYAGIEADGDIAGYAFMAKGAGYQGEISVIFGIGAELDKLKGIEVLESLETPGLGGKITDAGFKDQFKGLSTLPEIGYVKSHSPENDNEVQAISGATISTRSIVAILNDGISKMRDALKR
ncbi:MAG: hypothetical protein AUJ75_03240 [Candidatus Omnitrophica bacterium CG1_02_49_10]|nr:MAG: hypothetical protein AUJ75_03240 [Candidatus Omnitrophica bacterium CG1_02_49_10]